ncbi:MAG: hypothetical protein K0U74_02910 [Alphaproteobacteria bacterium]|nr:hypothetical protein [Alphaproteobacteria bacterium]
MVAQSRSATQLEVALKAVETEDASALEKSEMLMEIAMGLQQNPKNVSDLEAAVSLYEKALEIASDESSLLSARIRARMGTALMATPAATTQPLERARSEFENALTVLGDQGQREEVAEAEMNLGLALQSLATANKARIQDAIAAYQRALRTFDKEKHPQEFAVLQNNLATAFLSIPFSDERSKMREALAVQAFREGLSVVTLVDHPTEYAMLQNNLGNALQYASSSHRIENGFRALEAYDEALRVRDVRNMPGEYANTVANKANCLANLPDDPENPDSGNSNNLEQAIALYREACELFERTGEPDKAAIAKTAIEELSGEFAASKRSENVH